VTGFSRFKYGYKIPKYTSIDNATTVMRAIIIAQRLECLRRKKCIPYAIISLKLGDGICQHNMEGCNYDNGGCLLFCTVYPLCDATEPYLVGDAGFCNEENDTPEYKNDGGDGVRTLVAKAVSVNGRWLSTSEYQKEIRSYAIIQIY
jgi:hypothetical protein